MAASGFLMLKVNESGWDMGFPACLLHDWEEGVVGKDHARMCGLTCKCEP